MSREMDAREPVTSQARWTQQPPNNTPIFSHDFLVLLPCNILFYILLLLQMFLYIVSHLVEKKSKMYQHFLNDIRSGPAYITFIWDYDVALCWLHVYA